MLLTFQTEYKSTTFLHVRKIDALYNRKTLQSPHLVYVWVDQFVRAHSRTGICVCC
jgi:hypothetical protein